MKKSQSPIWGIILKEAPLFPEMSMWKGDGKTKVFLFDNPKKEKFAMWILHVRGMKRRDSPIEITSKGVFFKKPPQKGNTIIAVYSVTQ